MSLLQLEGHLHTLLRFLGYLLSKNTNLSIQRILETYLAKKGSLWQDSLRLKNILTKVSDSQTIVSFSFCIIIIIIFLNSIFDVIKTNVRNIKKKYTSKNEIGKIKMKSFLLFICLFLTLSVVQGGGGRIVGGQSVPFGKYPSMVHSKGTFIIIIIEHMKKNSNFVAVSISVDLL